MTFPFSTLPGLALYAGGSYQNPTALGFKQDGIWHDISSQEVLETIRHAGDRLIEMGLVPGDRVGIAADSSPFWMMADLAALGAGAVTVPMFPNAARESLVHQIRDSGMRFLFVGDGAQRDFFLSLGDSIEHILVLSPRPVQYGLPGPWTQKPPVVLEPESWESRALAVRPSDAATLIYTSGSTGNPKGVELTHANLIHQIQAASRCFPLDSIDDSALSFLPLSHVFERMVAYYYLASGVTVRFAVDPREVGDDLRELRPTLLTTVPRFLEKVHDKIMLNARQSGGLSRRLALAALRRVFERGDDTPPHWKDRLYDRLVYRVIRERMGARLRLVICGSAPLDARLARFFINLGVPVYEGYGLTESSPVLAVNYPGHRKLGTVGPAFPGVELRIAPDGEVLARGANIMRGYFGDPEATRATLDEEGWLYTGDLGRLDSEGYLTISGRKKELFKTANGKYVAPVPIEQALAMHPLVNAAVVIAEGRPHATALIYPDFDALVEMRRQVERATGEVEVSIPFLRSPVVRERFEEIVQQVNDTLNSWERIHKFALADAPPTIESGELTPTLKLRRHAVELKYAAKIEGMYRERR
jgi:long-chain acyl-CoA synthetase